MVARCKRLGLALAAIGPRPVRRIILRRWLGYDISPTAAVSRLSWVSCDVVIIGAGARIGPMTLIRDLESLRLDEMATIGKGNWIYATRRDGVFMKGVRRDASLHLHQHAALTSRHLVDCSAAVTIGRFTTIAGHRSQLLTHSVDVRTNRQGASAITIGQYCLVGTGVIVLGGANVPNNCVIGAGAVVGPGLTEELTLYAGAPARAKGAYSGSELYFSRDTGRVH